MAHRIEEALTTWKFIIIGCLCYLAAIALFASEGYVSKMLERERQLNYGVLGPGPAGHAESRAYAWYKTGFVDNGMVLGTLRIVTPEQGSDTTSAAANAVSPALEYVESRVRTMWLLVYQLLVRLSVTVMWWPYGVLIFIPVIIDALTQRRIASTNFSTPSPTMHIMAKSMVWVFLIGAVAIIFAPLPLNPALTPLLIMLGASAFWLSITMFAKSA
ncbi:DUF4400 domain-containing protein [Xanthomonas perforans]|jgi:hypothetical protein|uniref:DUF4400 domain-containing protein n=2 Tax=Xanthomonas TaxID=338 RepID=A0A6P0E700_XANPE|nr:MULTISPECIES: DUF4400 domain-containing protein [Xanthomonas]KLC44584.1 hypothetical protein XP1712_15715 [Xanthomonas perforans]MBZ2413700.1 DUF4400 domain-containing protein [Xanthomonas perforans]MBZ2422094.1 DUF4400 domain-containing protein [Xanthomonas perforans]MBZ2426448.1 DUF4400 domain-containing protein [Xanthomonas perforans]MBZ2430904.1 DUF4400 domain-containing protein [Xanthomonas perforans]